MSKTSDSRGKSTLAEFQICSEKHIQTEEIDGTDILQKPFVFSFHLQFVNTDL